MLSKQQVELFQRDGFVIERNVLHASEVEALKARAELIASGTAEHVPAAQMQVEPAVAGQHNAAGSAHQPGGRTDTLRKMSHVAFFDDVFQNHAKNPRILDCIEALLGPDLKLYQDQLFMKPPQIGSRQSYHQDQPLGFHVEPADRMVTCWAALDDATIDNGCLWMLPGTHRQGWIDKDLWAQYEQQAIAGQLPAERPVELAAGDCSFHHGHILHSSRPNLTDCRRWGYATHYVSAHCRFVGQGDSDAVLVRGQSMTGCI